MTRVDLVIDELVLSGFDPRDRRRFADALEIELAGAVRPADVVGLARAGNMPALRPLEIRAGSDQHTLACGVGGAIAGALGRPRRGSGGEGKRP
jgi:hypothetical protein